MYNRTFTRWMYRGQRPHFLARTLGQLWSSLASRGIMRESGLVTLEVTGRTSGHTIALPLVVAVVGGQRYLVSMLGENVQWVKNVRAAGGRAVLRSGGREPVLLEDVPVEQRALILREYVRRAPGARPHMPVDTDAPLAEFAKIAADYPTFHVATPEARGARVA
jgi:deazaflavin-dependent oxidoreductase (nitroreductase family)